MAAGLSFGLFGAGWIGVRGAHGGPLPLDEALDVVILRIRWGPLRPLVDLIAWVNGPRQTIAGVAIVVIVGALWLRVAPLMIAGALSGPLYSVTVSIIARPRPPSVSGSFAGFGFPSGHAVFFTTYALLVGLVIRRRLPPAAARAGMVLLGLLWLVGVVSRVWERAHWPSDVLAGIALAFGWVALVLSVRWLSSPVLGDRDQVAGDTDQGNHSGP
ncbi:MAG: hypothetical protein QOK05_1318 [Chloroflexota bacterium]|nr:hypothetical protein [Chloroflexota bacterium]